MGLTSAELARQIRGSFFGAEAIREQRGREEIKVMVRLPKAQRVSEHDLEQLDIRTPTGGWVPLRNVATVDRGRAATSITREDGRRVVDVKAELGAGATSARPVLDDLAAEGGFLEELRARYPGLRTRFAGEAETQNESLANLGQNFLLALAAIFVLLAVPFRSYTQPIIVMTAIPMGFVGAIGGHLLHGYGLSVISVMGIIAAAGVVVNDSLVMIDAANNFRDDEGLTDLEAIIAAGKRRMRPILLTSLTTYAGLISMIFEKSTQARFLVPMALSLGYGVLFCTFVALLMIPAVYMIEHDVRTNLVRLWTWLYPSPPEEPLTTSPPSSG
jgi:multidrug efflux pump subunit AcrB